jgi:hypothetical protein
MEGCISKAYFLGKRYLMACARAEMRLTGRSSLLDLYKVLTVPSYPRYFCFSFFPAATRVRTAM